MHSLHNHTTWSDGRVDIHEIVRKGVEGGLKVIGISDHYATTRVKSIDNVDQYIGEITGLRKRFRNRIDILAGVELDASFERTDFDALDYEVLNRLDYILFEFVQDELWKGMPVWQLITIRKRFKIPCGIAHNDLGRNFHEVNIEYLADVFQSNKIFIELNCGRRYSKMGKYYYELGEPLILQLGRYGVRFSLGCEGHRDDPADISPAMEFVVRNQLEKNLISMEFFKKD